MPPSAPARCFTALRLLLLLGLALGLAACASRPAPVWTGTSAPSHWEAEGKAALRSGERGGNVYFTWTQTAAAYHIIVRGPLGLGRAELTGEPGRVRLNADHLKHEVSASSLEELLFLQTGRQAPVSHLRDWLCAQAATAGARLHYGEDGKLRRIEEDGWTIDYLEWSTEAPNLPRKLVLDGPDGHATVIVGLWRLIPTEAGPAPQPAPVPKPTATSTTRP